MTTIYRDDKVFYCVYKLDGRWRLTKKERNKREVTLGFFDNRKKAIVAARQDLRRVSNSYVKK